jgi:hypothetical protein
MRDRKLMFQTAASMKNGLVDYKNNPQITVPQPQPPVVEEVITPVEIIPVIEEPTFVEEPIVDIPQIENDSITIIKKK